MLKTTCRVCHQSLFDEALLTYSNMPKSAQNFPELNELKTEKGNDLGVFQCTRCGLVQLNNEPVHYYREVIRAAGLSSEMTSFRKQQFTDWIDRYDLSGKRVLEVGCGQGEYLSLLQQQNIDAFGIEFNSDSVDRCHQLGLNVARVFIDSARLRLDEEAFDGFVMLNFLEHLPEPNETLAGIATNLKQGAIGLIEVPNFDMILRKNLFSEFISDHLLYFTKETLVSTLTRNGFEVLECDEVWHNYSLSAVVRKRVKTELLSFKEKLSQLRSSLRQYLNQFPDNSVAVWGAGHQALSVMSLTGISQNIKYVVDSAPFKQNKFTPATHIPIVDPSSLKNDPVDAVIVIAGSYSSEVLRHLKRNFRDSLKIAVVDVEGLSVVSS